MQNAAFGNFQVGMVDDPSVEDQGGFEFASGMDIFSEPGVMKAANAMAAVPLEGALTLDALPTHLVRPPLQFGGRIFIAMGDRILFQTTGGNLDVYTTNGEGVIDGLGALGNYLVYSAGTDLGRVEHSSVGASQDDTYETLADDTYFGARAMLVQGGTLKIASFRYIESLDESFVLRSQALKLPAYTHPASLSQFNSQLFIGSLIPHNPAIDISNNDATIYQWHGIPLSSGAALPTTVHPIERRGAYALPVGASTQYALVDNDFSIFAFNGATFVPYRKLSTEFLATLRPNNESACEYDNGFIFSGNTDLAPGIFRLEGGAICQQFVPAGITPAAAADIDVGFVKIGHGNKVYIGYKKTVGMTTTYHIDTESTSKQTGALVVTLWHRMKTDQLKRWAGVKLNLKPLASGCSVAVYYRTDREAAFTDSGVSITSANQHRPVIFRAQPRTREIQFKFVYTTNSTNTPELITYDPLFEPLVSIR